MIWKRAHLNSLFSGILVINLLLGFCVFLRPVNHLLERCEPVRSWVFALSPLVIEASFFGWLPADFHLWWGLWISSIIIEILVSVLSSTSSVLHPGILSLISHEIPLMALCCLLSVDEEIELYLFISEDVLVEKEVVVEKWIAFVKAAE